MTNTVKITHEIKIVDKASYPQVGCAFRDKKGNLIYITGGQYYGQNGRISNFWYWRDINDDGTLGKTEHHGYWDW